MPGWPPKAPGSRDLSFTELFFKRDGMTTRVLCECRNNWACMGYDYDLSSLGCPRNEAGKGNKQVRMQTRLRLIEDHQRWRPWR